MSKIISVHEYVLKPGVNEIEFEDAIQKARTRGLLQLPGLREYHFVKGLRGARKGQYATIWVYESKDAWEKLWGSAARPCKKQDYPDNWKIWEEEVLAPFLSKEPDKIEFTAYEEL